LQAIRCRAAGQGAKALSSLQAAIAG